MTTPIIWTAGLAAAAAAIASDPRQSQDARLRAGEISAAPGQVLQPFQGEFIQALRQRLAGGLETTGTLEAAWAAACEADSPAARQRAAGPALHAAALEVLAEIRRLNAAAGETVFNPAATQLLVGAIAEAQA